MHNFVQYDTEFAGWYHAIRILVPSAKFDVSSFAYYFRSCISRTCTCQVSCTTFAYSGNDLNLYSYSQQYYLTRTRSDPFISAVYVPSLSMYMFVAVPISYVVVDSAPVGNAWSLDVGFVIPERLSLLYVSKLYVFYT